MAAALLHIHILTWVCCIKSWETHCQTLKFPLLKWKRDLLTGYRSVRSVFGTAHSNIWESSNNSHLSCCACVLSAVNTFHGGQRANACLAWGSNKKLRKLILLDLTSNYLLKTVQRWNNPPDQTDWSKHYILCSPSHPPCLVVWGAPSINPCQWHLTQRQALLEPQHI